MVALVDRLALSDEARYQWLGTNDTFLLNELQKIFKESLFVRGEPKRKSLKENARHALIQTYFKQDNELDYFIYSNSAPTHCGLKYVEDSRIMFYRPSKSYGVSRQSGMRHTRQAACRFVRLKEQILTIFAEEIVSK